MSDNLLEKHVPFDIEVHGLKEIGTASGLLPWMIRRRGTHYAIDWAGYLTVPADGEYTFHYNVLGAAYCWIGTHRVGTWYRGFLSTRPTEFKDFTVKLQKGAHPFRFVFSAHKYGPSQNLSVEWSGPGFAKQLIPTRAFTRSLTLEEQRAAGIAQPQVGADVWDWYPVTNPSLESPPAQPTPAPVAGNLELLADGPAADGYARFSVKAPAGLAEPVTYRWFLGDGTQTEGPNAAARYTPGVYTVTVLARDAQGRQLAAYRSLSIPDLPPFEAIGFRYCLSDGAGSNADLQRPSLVAGVIPQGYWNPLGPSYENEKPLDNQGREVATRIPHGKYVPWKPVYQARSNAADEQLLRGAGWANSSIPITGIPYARYDLILYCPGFGTEGQLAEYTVTVGGQTKTCRTSQAPSDFHGRWVEETDANPAGNYLLFRDLSGAEQTIQFSKFKNAKWPHLSAIQIIKKN